MIKFRERIRYGKEVLHVTSPSRASDAKSADAWGSILGLFPLSSVDP